jgi:hypothetical protein
MGEEIGLFVVGIADPSRPEAMTAIPAAFPPPATRE